MSYLGQQLGQGQAERFVYTASGGETSVTTSDDGRAIAYTVGQVDVYLNGAKLINGSDFTATTGTSITGLAALTASDVVEVFALSIFQASDTVSAASGGTFNGNVTMAANLSFGDNNKAIFGAGSDLQIYHTGANSIIDDLGTGNLLIRSDGAAISLQVNSKNSVRAVADADVELYYNGNQKLATTATGIDVTGTVTADGLTVSTATGSSSITPTDIIIKTETSASDWSTTDEWGRLVFYSDDISNGGAKAHATIGVSPTASGGGLSNLVFKTSNSTPSLVKRMDIDETGNISFYEDTGTTPKFFWDASAESLGIGTTSPDAPLHISQPSTGTAIVRLEQTDTTLAADQAVGVVEFEQNDAAGAGVPAKLGAYAEDANAAVGLRFYTGTGATANERMRIDSSGNFLVGTTSEISLGDTTGNGVQLNGIGAFIKRTCTTSTQGLLQLNNIGTTGNVVEFYIDGIQTGCLGVASGAALTFNRGTGSTEAMRLDSSGNLLVNTSSTASSNDTGFTAEPYSGGMVINVGHDGTAANGDEYVYFRRLGVGLGTITQVSSTGVAYNTTSDYRLKNVDGPITNSGAYIDALKPVQGSWKADGSRFIGLIAHEVQEVSETSIATGEKDGEEMQGMDYSAPELIANLIAEIQSLRARVAQLEGV